MVGSSNTSRTFTGSIKLREQTLTSSTSVAVATCSSDTGLLVFHSQSTPRYRTPASSMYSWNAANICHFIIIMESILNWCQFVGIVTIKTLLLPSLHSLASLMTIISCWQLYDMFSSGSPTWSTTYLKKIWITQQFTGVVYHKEGDLHE